MHHCFFLFWPFTNGMVLLEVGRISEMCISELHLDQGAHASCSWFAYGFEDERNTISIKALKNTLWWFTMFPLIHLSLFLDLSAFSHSWNCMILTIIHWGNSVVLEFRVAYVYIQFSSIENEVNVCAHALEGCLPSGPIFIPFFLLPLFLTGPLFPCLCLTSSGSLFSNLLYNWQFLHITGVAETWEPWYYHGFSG